MRVQGLIVCVPSNSPKFLGPSRPSIHPGLCLLSNLNLTDWAMERGIFLSHLIFGCIAALKDEDIKYDFVGEKKVFL